jgi:hypothetical protein
MIRKICKKCGCVTIRKTTPEGEEKRFCDKCDAFTDCKEAEMDPYCPDCGTKIIVCASG